MMPGVLGEISAADGNLQASVQQLSARRRVVPHATMGALRQGRAPWVRSTVRRTAIFLDTDSSADRGRASVAALEGVQVYRCLHHRVRLDTISRTTRHSQRVRQQRSRRQPRRVNLLHVRWSAAIASPRLVNKRSRAPNFLEDAIRRCAADGFGIVDDTRASRRACGRFVHARSAEQRQRWF